MKIEPLKNFRKFVPLVVILLITLIASLAFSRHITLIGLLSSLLYIFRYKFRRRSKVSDLIHVAYSLELFASVYTLTGSIKQALSYMGQKEYVLSGPFRTALLMIRDGSDPFESLSRIFKGSPIYRGWLISLINGSITDAQDVFSIWRNKAEEAVSKVDDVLSLVIVLATLVPVLFAIMLMVFGVRPPWLFVLVILQLVLFQGVYRWLGDLLSLLY